MALFSTVGSFLAVVALVSSQQPQPSKPVTMTDDGAYAKVRVKAAVGGQDGPENFEPGLYHPCSIDGSDYIMMFNYTVSWEEAEKICELNEWALATPTTENIFNHFVGIMSVYYPMANINSSIALWLGGVNVKGTNNGDLQWLTTGASVGDYFYANWTGRPTSTVGMESQCTVLDVDPSTRQGTGRHEACCQNVHNFMCRTGAPQITVDFDALKCPPSNTISSTEAPESCEAASSADLYPDYTESTFDGSIYTIVREPKLTWAEAKMACESQCSVLCEDVVHTSEEFEFLSKLTTCPIFTYANTTAVWLGKNCNSTGTNDCPNISLDVNGLNSVISTDGDCSEEHPFICKREQNLAVPVINTTG